MEIQAPLCGEPPRREVPSCRKCWRLGYSFARGIRSSITTPTGPAAVPVEGIFYDYATDGGKMVMDRTWYQRHWHDDRVTVYSVYLASGTDVEQVRQSIVTHVAGLDGMTLPPLVIRNHELRQEILEIFDRSFVLTYVLEAIAVLVAVLGIVNTLVTAVLERRREFAALRAIGASTRQVERLVLWEAAYLGLIGAALGVVGGLLLALLLIHVINKQSFGWTIQMTVPGGVILQAVGLCTHGGPGGWLLARALGSKTAGSGGAERGVGHPIGPVLPERARSEYARSASAVGPTRLVSLREYCG